MSELYLHFHVTIEERGKAPTRQTFLNYPTLLGWLVANRPEVGDRLVIDVRDPDNDEIVKQAQLDESEAGRE